MSTPPRLSPTFRVPLTSRDNPFLPSPREIRGSTDYSLAIVMAILAAGVILNWAVGGG